MRDQLIKLAVGTTLLGAAGLAVADHNSKNGEGWANMPNDIHNTRVDTRENNDNEAFREFVKFGEGSESVNRFESDDDRPKQSGTTTGAKGQKRTASRSRLDTRMSAPSRLNRSRISMRSGMRRGGGRR